MVEDHVVAFSTNIAVLDNKIKTMKHTVHSETLHVHAIKECYCCCSVTRETSFCLKSLELLRALEEQTPIWRLNLYIESRDPTKNRMRRSWALLLTMNHITQVSRREREGGRREEREGKRERERERERGEREREKREKGGRERGKLEAQ